jgi:sulfide:quinone oxidoreductase
VVPRILILGAGTAGTMTANRLRRLLPEDAASITVVDRDDAHVYRPGLLFVPFGLTDPSRLVRSRQRQLARGVVFVEDDVERVDAIASQVTLGDGSVLPYDALIVATGARLVPEMTPGMTGPGWFDTVVHFYTPDGASATAAALRAFPGGRLVVSIVDLPIRCPDAAIEFTLMADRLLRERGVRGRTELVFATPLDDAFVGQAPARSARGTLERARVRIVTDFDVDEVDGASRVLRASDGRHEPFELLVTVPLHAGAAFVGRSPGLGDEAGFVLADPHTLQARVAPNVFAIGDAASLATSRPNSLTRFAAATLAFNVGRFLAGKPLAELFDAHTTGFVEPGAAHRRRDLDAQGRLLFEELYWHALLSGREGFPFDVEPLAGGRKRSRRSATRSRATAWLPRPHPSTGA